MTAAQYRQKQMQQMSEHQHQVIVVKEIERMGYPVFAVPNGTNKSRSAQVKFKAEGLRAGVPDLFVPAPKHGWHGLFIEMKSMKGRTTPQQRAWMDELISRGYQCEVCKGYEQAIGKFKEYINAN